MQGRSSPRRSLALLACALGACSAKKHDGVKGHVERVKVLASFMVENVPRPGVVGECKPGDFVGGYPMTHLSLLKLGGKTWEKERPEYADWINPAELDAPSARVLLDPAASREDQEYAAGDFIGAKFYVVYRVENVDAPVALGVKDLKMSTVGTHITKYGKDTIPVCSTVFHFQSSPEKSDWAIVHSDKAKIDPAVAQAVKDDLVARYLSLAPRVTAKP